ncbi:MAG: glycosyltransferase family 1 protein [Vicinamibacterales bacterium]
MRVLIDYRAALRERSGVGEYTHQLVRALLEARVDQQGAPLDITVFSSSSKDRLVCGPDLAGSHCVDRRVPVRLLNLAWHRLGWPSAETLAGGVFDIAHSLHPLLMPARRAAQVVTIHDLNFLYHPERTRAEIRRDYPALARSHAHRADRVIVVSEFTRREVVRLLEVPADRITVASPGGPNWTARTGEPRDGYVLFFGTLEPRKNLGALLDAWEILLGRRRVLPELRIAGKTTDQSDAWLARMSRPPLSGAVRHVGYVAPDARRDLYTGARLLVQPSFEEGFGLPVLEAMTVGVPVVAADAGALPEVGADAVRLVTPTDPDAMADAIEALLDDEQARARATARGLARAAQYNWASTAAATLDAYAKARAGRTARRGVA